MTISQFDKKIYMCFNLVKKTFGILFVVVMVSLSSTAASNPPAENPIPEDFELQIKLRLRVMDCVVVPRLNEDVKLFLTRYIFKYPRNTERMLGNAALYFPVFDQILREKNMPASLKALSILESWLDQGATSRVGAGGLWQLMPGTARMYGLTVNDQVDERRDIYKSTEAALNLLGRLHEIYGDWGLALAAYNAGPLKVNRAIEKAGGAHSFWAIAPYLPKETQQFVPKFIALSYLINHYADHEIYPEFPDLDLQFIDVIQVHQKLSFQEVNKVTGISADLIKSLNPGYKFNNIPQSKKGYNLVLPARVMPAMVDYLNLTDKADRNTFLTDLKAEEKALVAFEDIRVNYIETVHIVQAGETLQEIAEKNFTDITRIALWNHLTSEELVTGMELTVFLPIDKYLDTRSAYISTFEPIPGIDLNQLLDRRWTHDIVMPDALKGEQFELHVLGAHESFYDICLKYDIKDVHTLLELNKGVDPIFMIPGSILKVKVLPSLDSQDVSLNTSESK